MIVFHPHNRPKPLILCILDGWGYAPDAADNAISLAHTPTWDRWLTTYPLALLEASGPSVGLPEGQMGNSEVGHMTLGSGRAFLQELPRISKAFHEKVVSDFPQLESFIASLRSTNGSSHLLGLLSSGGVHSHKDHIIGMAQILASSGISVVIHAFLDGRDTPPQSASEYLREINTLIAQTPLIRWGTIMGRFYAMDRDHRWERTEQAYKAIMSGTGTPFSSSQEILQKCYLEGLTDEFIPPYVHKGYQGIHSNDGIIAMNFRADRMRQLCQSLVDPHFISFPHPHTVLGPRLSLTSYSTDLDQQITALFTNTPPKDTLGEILAHHNLSQLRIAETEKYAHVTFFFNGGREEPFSKEDRILIPSPPVSTYDQAPAMSAQAITQAVTKAIDDNTYDVIILNFANADMVGHSGKIPPTIQAIESLDQCLEKIETHVNLKNGVLIVTADHGNAEEMTDPKTHTPQTAHSLNKVPLIIIHTPTYPLKSHEGSLQDVAPTILSLLHIPAPHSFKGKSLI